MALKDKIRQEIRIFGGEVLKIEEHNFTSTQVHASGTAKNINVTSQINHHQKQDIWFLEANGVESSVHLRNCNVAVRESQQIMNVAGCKTNNIYRFVNRTTGFYWRVHGKKPPQTAAGNVFVWFFQKLMALIFAAILCFPYINFLLLLSFLGYLKKDDFSKFKRLGLIFNVIIAFLILGAYCPYLVDFAPQYSPPQEFKIDSDLEINIAVKVSNMINEKQITIVEMRKDILQNPNKYNLALYRTKTHPENPNIIIFNNAKDNYYMLISSLLLFLILFLYFSWSMATEMRIQKALDKIAIEELQKHI